MSGWVSQSVSVSIVESAGWWLDGDMELLGRSVRAAVGGARPPVVDELARQSQSTIKITTLSQPGTNLYTVTY